MTIWLAIVLGSACIGALCARIPSERLSLIAGAAAPWFTLLAGLLFNEYALPYRGGGASMWPIAQLFGGAVAAVVGIGSCAVVRSRRRKAVR
jgi:hypothetical protein